MNKYIPALLASIANAWDDYYSFDAIPSEPLGHVPNGNFWGGVDNFNIWNESWN